MDLRSLLRTGRALAVALLPNALKLPVYRHLFGYRIGRGVRIGLTLIDDVPQVEIGDECRIGHFNRFKHVPSVQIGDHSSIGHFNQFVSSAEFTHPASLAQRGNAPRLVIGRHVGISSRHYVDIEDTVSIGSFTTLAGLHSVIFTHGIDVIASRQSAKPVSIGAYAMIGSNVLFHPGSGVGDCCVVGMGSVVTRRFGGAHGLIGGNPAKWFGPLPASARYFHRSSGWIGSYVTPPFPLPPDSADVTPEPPPPATRS